MTLLHNTPNGARYKRFFTPAFLDPAPQQPCADINSTNLLTKRQRTMDIRRCTSSLPTLDSASDSSPAYHSEADRLATVAMLFLDKYSGTYRTRDVLRAQVEIYLDKEYPHDLKWLDCEKDLEYLVDLIKNAGGIVIGKLERRRR